MSHVFFEGFLLQASLIFALGAQNLFVLESGLRKDNHLTVSLVCFLCDLTIIMTGVIGTATFLGQHPQVKILCGILGILFLVYYGIGKIRTTENEIILKELNGTKGTLWKSVLGAITFSVINPHAYLDGIVLIGGYSSKFHELNQRVFLGFGAASCSLVWFLTLSSASSTVMPLLNNPRRMRLAMSTAGVILMFLSLKLGVDVYGWIVEAVKDGPTLVLKASP